MTTSFIRGVTLRNATIIIDECQNMSFHELDSIITRVGEGCRVSSAETSDRLTYRRMGYETLFVYSKQPSSSM